MIDDATAIILAGGTGSRMGTDKLKLSLGDEPLVVTIVRTMECVFQEILISVRYPRPELTHPQVCDTSEHRGPLVGLTSTMPFASTPWIFAVGGDMPFVSPQVVRYLATLRQGVQAVVPVVHGKLQPLMAFYSSTALPHLCASLSSGNRKLSDALRLLQVRYVAESTLHPIDPELKSFFDLDTPQDWALAKEWNPS